MIDNHLADQLILPLALAGYAGSFSTERLSKHALTNIWLVEQFLGSVAVANRTKHIIQFRSRP